MASTIATNIEIRAKDLTKKGFDSVTKKTKGLNSATSELRGNVVGLIGAYAGIQGAKAIIEITDAYKNQTSQLRLVSNSEQDLNRIRDVTLSLANETRSATESTVNLYARLTRATAALGLTEEKRLNLTKLINQSGVVSGATVQEQTAAIIQLTQGLASGVFRGQEFNSVMEQTPRIALAIADGMKLPVAALRHLASEGLLTTEVVTKALLSQSAIIDAEFSKVEVTVSGAFQVLKNTTRDLIAGDNGVASTMLLIVDAILVAEQAFRELNFYVSQIIGFIHKNVLQFVAGVKIALYGMGTVFEEIFNKIKETIGQLITKVAESLKIMNGVEVFGEKVFKVFSSETVASINDIGTAMVGAAISTGKFAQAALETKLELREQQAEIDKIVLSALAFKEAKVELTAAEKAAVIAAKKRLEQGKEEREALDASRIATEDLTKSANKYLESLQKKASEANKTTEQIIEMTIRNFEAAGAEKTLTDAMREAAAALGEKTKILSEAEKQDLAWLNAEFAKLDALHREETLVNDLTDSWLDFLDTEGWDNWANAAESAFDLIGGRAGEIGNALLTVGDTLSQFSDYGDDKGAAIGNNIQQGLKIGSAISDIVGNGSEDGAALGGAIGAWVGGAIAAAVSGGLGAAGGAAIGSAIGGAIGALVDGTDNARSWIQFGESALTVDASDVFRAGPLGRFNVEGGRDKFAGGLQQQVVSAIDTLFSNVADMLSVEDLAAAMTAVEGMPTLNIDAQSVARGDYLDDIFNVIVNELDPTVVRIVNSFKGIENRLEALGTTMEMWNVVEADPLGAFNDAQARKSLKGADLMGFLAGEAKTVAEAFDGSIHSMENVTTSVQDMNNEFSNFLATVEAVGQIIGDITDQSVRQLGFSALGDDAGAQIAFLNAERQSALDELRAGSSDPEQIANLVAEINTLTLQLSNIQPETFDFQANIQFLKDVENLANQQLEIAKEAAVSAYDKAIEDIKSIIAELADTLTYYFSGSDLEGEPTDSAPPQGVGSWFDVRQEKTDNILRSIADAIIELPGRLAPIVDPNNPSNPNNPNNPSNPNNPNNASLIGPTRGHEWVDYLAQIISERPIIIEYPYAPITTGGFTSPFEDLNPYGSDRPIDPADLPQSPFAPVTIGGFTSPFEQFGPDSSEGPGSGPGPFDGPLTSEGPIADLIERFTIALTPFTYSDPTTVDEFGEPIADDNSNMLSIINRLIRSIGDERFGADSPLTIPEQFAEAQAKFDSLYGIATGGTDGALDAASELDSARSILLGLANQMFTTASEEYNNLFFGTEGKLLDVIGEFGAQIENPLVEGIITGITTAAPAIAQAVKEAIDKALNGDDSGNGGIAYGSKQMSAREARRDVPQGKSTSRRFQAEAWV